MPQLSDEDQQRLAMALGYTLAEYPNVPNLSRDLPIAYYNRTLLMLTQLEHGIEDEEDCRRKMMALEAEDLKVDYAKKLTNLRLESRSIVDQLSQMLDIPVRQYRVHLPTSYFVHMM